MLAVGEADGGPAALVKISGDLVRLSPDEASDAARGFSSGGLTVRLETAESTPLIADEVAESVDADMRLTLNDGLSAGYRGYFGCGA